MKISLIFIAILLITGCDNKFSWIEPAVEIPVVHSINPDKGTVGTEVTVSGDHFSTTLANISVTINGIPATITQASASTITFTAPTTTTGPVVVVVNNQHAENQPVFTYP